jgi:hypothetical protein
MIATRPCFTSDLLPSERQFVNRMQDVGFGRFEYLQIRGGEIVLDSAVPIRDVKFGAESAITSTRTPDFELKRQVAELFEYTRAVDAGEIRVLEIRHGLPFSMEIEMAATRGQGGRP